MRGELNGQLAHRGVPVIRKLTALTAVPPAVVMRDRPGGGAGADDEGELVAGDDREGADRDAVDGDGRDAGEAAAAHGDRGAGVAGLPG